MNVSRQQALGTLLLLICLVLWAWWKYLQF
jgi:hypothetical protein